MSRHGYTDDWDGEHSVLAHGRWQAQLQSAIRGKRGQAFLRALVEALDAMPVKSLAPNSLETKEGAVCALGCLARHRGIDVKTFEFGEPYSEDPDEGAEWSDSDWQALATMFDIAPQLAREVMYANDECSPRLTTPAGYLAFGQDYAQGPLEHPDFARWRTMRRWAAKRIVPTEEELVASGGEH